MLCQDETLGNSSTTFNNVKELVQQRLVTLVVVEERGPVKFSRMDAVLGLVKLEVK